MKIRALHLEDDATDALFVRETLQSGGIDAEVTVTASEEEYLKQLESGKVDLIMVDNGLPGFNGAKALQIARERRPDVPFIFVSAAYDEKLVAERLAIGATDYVPKDKMWQLPAAVRRATGEQDREPEKTPAGTHHQAIADLERRVEDLTRQLHAAHQELESFSYSVSHDLQAPLRAISGFTELLREECKDSLSEQGKRYLRKVLSETQRMNELIQDLLRLARYARGHLRLEIVDLSRLARLICRALHAGLPQRAVDFRIQEGWRAQGDSGLLRIALENLLSNAWKYSSRRSQAVIEFGATERAGGERVFFVKDNGAGFDMNYATHLFAPFQRMHRQEEFPGNGIGLATVQRIIHRHGGRVWAESAVDQGATFFFTLREPEEAAATVISNQ